MIRRALTLVTLSLLSACSFNSLEDRPLKIRSPEDGECLRLTRTELDFGEIEVGTKAISRLNVFNDMKFDVELRANASAPFSVRQTMSVMVPAGESKLIDLEVAPTKGGPSQGEVVLEDPSVIGGCRLALPVKVLGGNWLEFADVLDFGFVDPGQVVQRSLRFTNATSRVLSVSNFVVEGDSFSSGVPMVFSVPPYDSIDVPFFAQPPALGTFTGEVSFLAPGGRHTVVLAAVGAHPTARFSAQRIDFQRVALFPSGPSFGERQLFFSNVGLSDVGGETQLRVVLPHVLVEPLENATETELLVDVSRAIQPIAANESAAIGLRVEPNGFGRKKWRVTIYTNDPVTPAQQLEVVAEVVSQPPCSVSASPAAGVQLTPYGDGARGELVLTNTGSSECVVDDVRLDESTAPGIFTLESGQITQVALPPGEVHRVVIKAGSTGGTTQRGELRFHVLSPGEGVRRVAFAAQVP